MRAYIVPLCMILLSQNVQVFAQVLNFDWAVKLDGEFYEHSHDIEVDDLGNSFILGVFNDTVDFDPSVNELLISSAGNYGHLDFFILKLNPSGELIWAKTFGNESEDVAYDIVIDHAGDLLIAGYFNDSVDFDPDTTSSFYLSSQSYSSDAFILKLSSDGGFIWAKSYGGMSQEKPRTLGVDSNNNIFCSGIFHNSVDFDPGSSIYTLVSIGTWDTYLQKLDHQGNFVWATSIGGLGDISPNEIAIDSYSNIYMVGEFEDSVDFDPSTFVNYLDGGLRDGFITKFDSAGNFVWANQLNGWQGGEFTDVKVSNSDKLFVSGNYSSGGAFISNLDTIQGPPCGYSLNSMLLKLTLDGDIEWGRAIGGQDHFSRITSIDVDSLDNVYCAGTFDEQLDFNVDNPVHQMPAIGLTDIFNFKYDKNGNFAWSLNCGGPISGWIYIAFIEPSVVLDHIDGSVLTTGVFNYEIDFDFTPSVFNLESLNSSLDCYVLKIGQSSLISVEEDTSLKFNISIYPNPVSDNLIIETGNLKEETIYCDLYNAQGSVINSCQILIDEKAVLDLEHLTPGIYFISLYSGTFRVTQRLIKQ
jgi:hypothetical protein